MKYLIVGLGNPGREYENTRHNVGFLVVDAIAKDLGGSFTEGKLGWNCEVKFKGHSLVLLKPNTFMNLSGKAVRYWMQFHKIPKEQLLVVVDELALPFGTLRMKGKGSAGGHNGLKDIEAILATQEYPRLRFGISAEFGKGKQVDYVLGEWNEMERAELPDYLAKSVEAVKSFAFVGLERAMNVVNQ